MSGIRRRTVSEEEQLVKALLDRLRADLQAPQRFVIPNLQNDPDEQDPTNLWMRWDGRLRGRYWNGASYTYVDYPMRSDITGVPAVPASPAPPAKPPLPVTHRATWTATWSQSYKGDGTKRTDGKGETYLVYGNADDGVNGTQRALVGFDYAAIQTALAGSIIKTVELQMTNVHAYWNSGVDVYFGMHNVTAEPSTWPASGSLLYRRNVTGHFGKPETKTIILPNTTFGSALRSGAGKGLAIEAPTDDLDYYGYAAGVASGYTPPQLTITYTK